MYGLHTIGDRRALWKELVRFSRGVDCPWMIVGDFNAVLRKAGYRTGN